MTWFNSGRHLPALLLSFFALATVEGSVAAETDAAAEAQNQAPQAGHHNHRRGPKKIFVDNTEGASITFWNPDLTTQTLQAEEGAITLPRTGIDSYHALVVERNMGDRVESLIRYEYLRGKPSKVSPAELAGARKTRFEIVPDPIPREHYDYYSDQTWGFILRLDGQPLAATRVILQTEHGSQVEGTTDQTGKVSLRIPDDFPDIQPGVRDERSAGFKVRAETLADGIRYATLLSADYEVNPAHWQSFGWGVTVAGIGFLVGGFIGRAGSKKRQGEKS